MFFDEKEKVPSPSRLQFQGRFTPIAVSSLLAFAGGGASVYMSMENQYPTRIQTEKNITFQTCFTPRNQCQPLLISTIDEAHQTIYMQNYSFTSVPIADALKRAHARGVNVQIISDKGQFHARSATLGLVKAGIPMYVDQKVAIAHNKILIIDEHTVITGSYNFSTVAENRNAENVLIIGCPDLAQQYLDNWYNRQAESQLFNPLHLKNKLHKVPLSNTSF